MIASPSATGRPPPRRRHSRGRPPFRRVHVGRLGFHGPAVHCIVRPNGDVVDIVFDRTPRAPTIH